MSAVRTDYHIHTTLCHHAVGDPMEYVRAAQRAGLTEIGFADHNPMPERFDEWRMSIEDLPRYLDMVEEARSTGFPVRLGLECDYIDGYESWVETRSGVGCRQSEVPFAIQRVSGRTNLGALLEALRPLR